MKDPALFPGPQCDLIIVDRGCDPVAPIMHPFHYEAAVHDYVPLEDNFIYKFSERDGAKNVVIDVLLNEEEPLMRDWRHRHLGEVANLMVEKLEKIGKNKAAQIQSGSMSQLSAIIFGWEQRQSVRKMSS